LLFEIENISHTLIDEPKNDPKNKYFRAVPREFLELGLLVLLTHNPDLATPGGLAGLIGDPETWNSVLDIESEEGEPVTKSRARQLQQLRDDDPEHYSQHYLAALAALKIFQNGSALSEAGRGAVITHAQLLEEHYIVCLVQNQRNASRLSAYYGLHFNSFMSAQLGGKCGRTDYIFDEAANTPARDMIEKVTIQRAFGARTLYIFQSRADAQRIYGEKEIATLEGNCSKQWLKFSNIEEAERVSRAMGEIDTVTNNLGLNSDKNEFSGNFQTGRERLLTAEELMSLPADEQILFIDGVGFIHCRVIRQNQIAPYCYQIAINRVEGGKLPPDPKVTLPTNMGREQ
jgi:type IV secretion system protein VirD4